MSTVEISEKKPPIVYLKDYEVPAYLIDEVDLWIDLYEGYAHVFSTLKIKRNPKSIAHQNTLMLNGEELTLISVFLNETILKAGSYQLIENNLYIFNVPDQFDLNIETKIFPEKNTALSGLYRVKNTYCTQCEAEGFRRITYFIDRPDVLSCYTTTITAEKKFPYLLSNGNLVASGPLENGRHFAKWIDPFKKPCYLFALVAGDFDVLTDSFITQSKNNIALKIFVERGYIDQAQHAMYALKTAMRWDEEAFGREYDLATYMIVATHDFNMGAMENKGLNIFNSKYILANPNTATDQDYIHILSVIGHEYFHNWSGNRVTCRDWFQLSLKEGLTIFRDQCFSEAILSKTVMRIHSVNELRETQFIEDAGPLAHSVRPDSYLEINNFYTATVYNKGAEVLRMLQTILGKELFRQGMDLYFATFDGQAVTIEDFVHMMEKISGQDFHQFRLWYEQAGTPILSATSHYDEKRQLYQLTLSQTCPQTPNQPLKLPLHIPVRMSLLNDKGETLLPETILSLQTTSHTYHFENITSRPIPSLLRNFSAPVKLQCDYSDDDLIFLSQSDSDLFNRHEALQQYFLRVLLRLIKAKQQNEPLSLPVGLVTLIEKLLSHSMKDAWFISEMILLPSEKYISEQMDIIEVEAIHFAREFVLNELSQQLKSQWQALYHELNQPVTHHFSVEMMGKRQLKNRCLQYLLQSRDAVALGIEQFTRSLTTNMTDTLSALSALVNINFAERQTILNQFYETWKHDALVLDKWFAIQASSKLSSTLATVKQLWTHEAFDIKNPNKVYSLLGAFTQRNQINFHAINGEAYAFLRERVEELNQFNPIVAARMVRPLTNWQRYDSERQKAMHAQLAILAQQPLSTDLYELVTKSL